MINKKRILLFALSMLFITAASAQATPQPESDITVKRLAYLCKVWGFVKYYHPGITSEKVNWDQALIKSITPVIKSQNKAEFNEVIDHLLVAADSSKPVLKTSSDGKFQLSPDMVWIQDSGMFENNVIQRLDDILLNYSCGGEIYKYNKFGFIVFKGEEAYLDMVYPNQEYRLLSLFRYWNTINFFYPYKDLIGEDWSNTLYEFIPRMINAKDSLDYHLGILELTTHIRDGQGNICSTNSNVMENYFGRYYPPIWVDLVEGKTVVTRIFSDSVKNIIKVGDVITSIDGIDIADYRTRIGKYICASNEAGTQKFIDWYVLLGSAGSTMKLVLNDNKAPIELKRNTDFFSIEFPAVDLIKIVDGKYGYINFDRITSNRDIRKSFKILKGTEGVIVDIRNGTGNYKIDYFSRFIAPENKPYIKWNIPNPNCIGSFYNIVEKTSKKSSGKRYKGKVVLLIDENVQSDTETACMLFQTCQQVTLIGTPTAGANGYMALIQLPGGIRTGFSVMGVYYPNGKTNQRTGIQPDIYAANTVEYVREGRDMIIERAIEFLKTGK